MDDDTYNPPYDPADPRTWFPAVRPLSPLVPFDAPRVRPVNPPGNFDLPHSGGGGYTGPVAPNNATPDSVIPPLIAYNPANFARLIEGTFPLPNNAAGEQSVVTILQPAGLRNMIAFRNLSAAAVLYIGWGSAATLVSTFSVAPGGTLLLDAVVPQDDVYVLGDAAGGSVAIAYSNIPKAQ